MGFMPISVIGGVEMRVRSQAMTSGEDLYDDSSRNVAGLPKVSWEYTAKLLNHKSGK